MRGAILAGGRALRFGGYSKGLFHVGGRRMLDRVANAVLHATGRLPLIIANDPAAASWRPDLETTPDVQPGCGSIGGVYTAVRSAAGPVLCVAWDMPFVTPELLSALIRGSQDWDVFLPASRGPRGFEPLCAVYGPACGAALERQFARGELHTTAFYREVKVGILPLESVQTFGDPDVLFLNVNGPDDLEHAEALWNAQQR